jgi:hypothetical protein
MSHVSKNMNLYNQLTAPAIIFIISCINQSINKEALLPHTSNNHHQTTIFNQINHLHKLYRGRLLAENES